MQILIKISSFLSRNILHIHILFRWTGVIDTAAKAPTNGSWHLRKLFTKPSRVIENISFLVEESFAGAIEVNQIRLAFRRLKRTARAAVGHLSPRVIAF